MRIRNELKRRWRRHLYVLLACLVTASSFTPGSPGGKASAAEPQAPIYTVASWTSGNSVLTDAGAVVTATDGINKAQSAISAVGSGLKYDSQGGAVGGPDGGLVDWRDGYADVGGSPVPTKYWLAVVSTKNFKSLTLSSEQKSGNSGPKHFNVEISVDNTNWTLLKSLALPAATYTCPGDTCRLTDFPLPEEADDKAAVYIRWGVVSGEAANPSRTLGDYGVNILRNVVVKGEAVEGANIPIDTQAPSVPANVAGVGLTDTSIRLNWDASTDNEELKGYHIYRDGTKIGSSVAVSYTDSAGLARDTSYEYYVTAYDAAGNESAASAAVQVRTRAAAKTNLASWVIANSGDEGVIAATAGSYKGAATLQNSGGVFEAVDAGQSSISYQGWDGGENKKYWLVAVPTKGFQNIAVTSDQNSSGSGPRDFKLQMSTDNRTWTDVPNTNLTMSVSNYNCANDACKLNNAPLSANADDRDLLYLRWIVNSNVNTNGMAGGIGGSGSSRIRNIQISGEQIPGAEIVVPTIDMTSSPRSSAVEVLNNAPVVVKFNKAIKFNEGHSIGIKDQHDTPMAGVAASVVSGNQLHVSHPDFIHGNSYTVTIPKEAISGTDDSSLIRDVIWSFTIKESPVKPKLFNMTFNGDPRTSIGFAWYTDQMTGTVVEVVEASQMTGNAFPAAGAKGYEGKAEEVATFMTASDRGTNAKTKFYSHKAIADGLKPGTAYKYRVGNGEAGSWSPIGSFTTDSAEHQSYRFIVGADSQSSSLSGFEPWGDTFRKAVDFIGDPKFLIVAGDLVDNGDLESHWQWMFTVAEDSLLKVPYVPVLGGHEVNDYDGDVTTDNDNFYYHFNVPKQVVEDTHPGSVYSFEYGDALYMVFNSQYEGGLAANGKDIDWEDPQFRAQVDWMRNTVARTDKKWKFVTFHKSPYASGDNSAMYEDSRVQFYRQHLIPVFDELGIDMVFEAHDHMYMRSFQMYGNEVVPKSEISFDENGHAVNPKGTVYLMPNALGNKFYTKQQWLYEFDENWNPVIKKDEHGQPIPYDHFFADVNEQPAKKMFTDVAIDDKTLSFKSYTAAVADEGQPGTVGNGLIEYDKYGIKRTDVKPERVERARAVMQENDAVLTWKAPSGGAEPVRGFRIYEKHDKVATHWSAYIPVEQGKTEYSYTIPGLNPAKRYNFVVKAVGTRMNSDPVEAATMDGPDENEPPSAPANLKGEAVSQFQVRLTWQPSPGNVAVSGYDVYRDGVKIGHTAPSVTSFTDLGLAAGTAYSYYVIALNSIDLGSLPSHTVAVTTKQPASGEGPHKPFPQHAAYVGGSIKPNHVTQAEMDATVIRLYREWKQKYLQANPYDSSQKYVWYTDDLDRDDLEIWEPLEGGGSYFPITVSEAHGYGMMITALMAGRDPAAQDDFDAMYRYFRAHPSEINPQLMAWRQGDTGTEIIDVSGVDSATDGDMDIAYSLLLADQQWGSQGDINYLEEAKKVIRAIMDSEVYQTDWTLRIADWATSGKYAGATRASDFMLQHMKDYGTVTGDERWGRTVDGTYRVIDEIFKNYSPNAGLLPDFIVKQGDRFVPAEPYWLESEHDGDYYYNSSRVPWRIATDYLVTGDKRAKDQLTTLNRWIRGQTQNDPSRIFSGYKLDGSAGLQASVEDEWQDITFIAPFMVSATIDEGNQQWLNDLWDYSAAIDTEDEVYFGNNIRMLSMIVVSGNWWSPTFVDAEAPTAPVIDYANPASSSAIELRWLASSDNLGVAGYEVYRDGQLIATTNKTQYKDVGLTANKQYAYMVIAFDAAGNKSKASNMRLVTTKRQESGPSSPGGTLPGGTEPANPTGPTKPQEPANPSNPGSSLPELKDIGKHWAEKEISRAVQQGLIKGYSDQSFRPNNPITRAEFAVILVRALQLSGSGSLSKFKDERSVGTWAKEAIAIATEAGIVTGYADGTFRPNTIVTRTEMAVMLMRAIGLSELISSRTSFADDKDIPSWAKASIEEIRKLGIMQGRGNDRFEPGATATRAEAVVTILRLLDFIKDK